MLKRCRAEPLAEAMLRPDHGTGRTAAAMAFLGAPFPLKLNKGRDRLQAPVVGTRVHGLYRGFDRHEMPAKFPRLLNAVGGEGRVHRDSCW